MSTNTSTNFRSLSEILSSDHENGIVYRHLFGGGSWFEAEQMHWRILLNRNVGEINTLLTKNPSPANVERAQASLGLLNECVHQLVAEPGALVVATQCGALVKNWSTPKAPTVNIGTNAFGAFLDDSDDE